MSVLDLDVPPSVCVRIDCMPHYVIANSFNDNFFIC